MRRFNYQVLASGNQSFFLAGIGPPQNEDNRLLLLIDDPNDGVRKWLPNLTCMAVRHTGWDCQTGIEQQDALLGPGR